MNLTDKILNMNFQDFYDQYDCENCPVKDDCTHHPDKYVPCRDEEFVTVQDLIEVTSGTITDTEEYYSRLHQEEFEKEEKQKKKNKKSYETRMANYSINKEITKKRRIIRNLHNNISRLNSLSSTFSIVRNMVNNTSEKPKESVYEIETKEYVNKLEKELEELIKERKKIV